VHHKLIAVVMGPCVRRDDDHVGLRLHTPRQHRAKIRPRALRLGPCHLRRFTQTKVAVDQPLARMIFYRHAGIHQGIRIRRALVAQRIEPRGG